MLLERQQLEPPLKQARRPQAIAWPCGAEAKKEVCYERGTMLLDLNELQALFYNKLELAFIPDGTSSIPVMVIARGFEHWSHAVICNCPIEHYD